MKIHRKSVGNVIGISTADYEVQYCRVPRRTSVHGWLL